MPDVKYARGLLAVAERHIAVLRVTSCSDEVFEDVFTFFHVQHAAEKPLNEWLALGGKVYPLTHTIEALLDFLSERADISRRFHKLIDHTPYAVEFCFRGIASGIDPIDRKRTLALVEELLKHVRRRWPIAGGS